MHKGETQDTSAAMPKLPYTVQVNGVYKFRKRYPTHLIEAGIVSSSHRIRSLGTKDRAVAAKRVVLESNQFQRDIEALEIKHGQKSELHERANVAKGLTPLSVLSKREQRDIVLSWFVELEANAQDARNKFRESDDFDWREECFDAARDNLGASEGNGPFEALDWTQEFQQFLKRKGLTFDAQNGDPELLTLYKQAKIESQWRTLESFEGREYVHRDPAFSELHATSQVTRRKPKTRTISELCEEFREAKLAAGRSPATMKNYDSRFDALKGAIGAETNLASLDDQHGGDAYEAGKKIVAFLASLPAYAKSRYKGHSLAEACNLEATKPNPQTIEAKTQSLYFTDIKAIFGFARKRHWISQNPLDGLEDSLPEIREMPREMLTGSELTALLSSPEFLREQNRKSKGARAEGKFWCVILCLYHGMRLNEVASLLVSDVKQEEDIWFLDLTEFDDEGLQVKRLKNKSSRRRVPLHEQAIKIGFLEFVQGRIEEGGENWLFPDLKPNSIGNRGGYTSRWFSRIRDRHLGKQNHTGDKGIHSFRHSVADAIRGITESDEILYEIGGWGSDKRGNSSRQYGKGDLKRLKQVIDKVRYEDFDPSFLYPKN